MPVQDWKTSGIALVPSAFFSACLRASVAYAVYLTLIPVFAVKSASAALRPSLPPSYCSVHMVSVLSPLEPESPVKRLHALGARASPTASTASGRQWFLAFTCPLRSFAEVEVACRMPLLVAWHASDHGA